MKPNQNLLDSSSRFLYLFYLYVFLFTTKGNGGNIQGLMCISNVRTVETCRLIDDPVSPSLTVRGTEDIRVNIVESLLNMMVYSTK